MEGQQLLTELGISFNGNPVDPIEWKKANASSGCDIYTSVFQMEFKVANFTVYPSHVYRHVLTRFDNEDSRGKVVVTNNKRNWYGVKGILELFDVTLWDLDDVRDFYSMPSFTSIYNFIRRDVWGTSNLYKLYCTILPIVSSSYDSVPSTKEYNKQKTFRTRLRDMSFTHFSSSCLREGLNVGMCSMKDVAQRLIKEILEEEGISVKQQKDNDTKIGIMIWNWSKPYKYSPTIHSILEALKPFEYRFLVASYLSPSATDYILNAYALYPIHPIELGFQILPIELKDSYQGKNVVFYPSKKGHDRVKEQLKPLVKGVKEIEGIGVTNILAKHCRVLESEDAIFFLANWDDEEAKIVDRELLEYRRKSGVMLIEVPEPII
jgi:hypothetical protein